MFVGERIILRTVRSSDMDEYVELASDITAQCEHFPRSISSETRIRDSFHRNGMWTDDYGVLLVIEKETQRIIGSVMFFKPVQFYDCFEIGYVTYNPADRGKGYIVEACRLLIQYLFDLKQIYRIQIQCSPLNIPSNRVALRLGFTLEGTMRQAFISKGKPGDVNVYSILRSEFESKEA